MTVAVAFSGGRDSTALLYATVAAAAPLGIAVLALHVHHGLSAHADAWLAHCSDFCRRLRRRGRDVAFLDHRVETRPQPGDSVEAWARRERYRALRRMAAEGGADLVLLAHHRRDQAETFLLQALRGGGVAALSAMPEQACREGITWARPWLVEPHEAIVAYARRHRLRFVDDDSNDDLRFARNRLRAAVWPALLASFPEAEASLAKAAGWAQQASAAVDEAAEHDLRSIAGVLGLDIAGWRALPPHRQTPALRRWLQRQSGRAAPASLVERLLVEIGVGGVRRWPAPDGALHSHRGLLRWRAGEPVESPPGVVRLDASRPGRYAIEPWRGVLHIAPVGEGGIALPLAADLTLRARSAADRFQAGPGRPRRSLKLQFQSAGISADERLVPVVCHGDLPVFVPGLGIDARALARPGEAQVALSWFAQGGDAEPAG